MRILTRRKPRAAAPIVRATPPPPTTPYFVAADPWRLYNPASPDPLAMPLTGR